MVSKFLLLDQLEDIPARYRPIKERSGYPCPEEFECHFRRHLSKKLEQPEFERKDIWYIDPEGSYLELALADVKDELERCALHWFERFEDMDEVLRTLEEDDENMDETWGFGKNPSPIRNYQLGYIALAAGNYEKAEKALKEAIDSGCFKLARLMTDYESLIKV